MKTVLSALLFFATFSSAAAPGKYAPVFTCISKRFTVQAQPDDETGKPLVSYYMDGKLLSWHYAYNGFEVEDNGNWFAEFDEMKILIAKGQIKKPTPEVRISYDDDSEGKIQETGYCVGKIEKKKE